MLKKINWFYFGLFLIVIALYCRDTDATSDTSSTMIEGVLKVHDVPLDLGISLNLFRDYSKTRVGTDAENFVSPVVNNAFSFSFDRSYPFYINLLHPQSLSTRLRQIYYLIEPGDKLFMKLYNDSISFSGIGSEKANCQFELHKINYQSLESYLISTGNFLSDGLANNRLLLNRKIQKLNEYKNKMSEYAYSQLLVNVIGDVKYNCVREFSSVVNFRSNNDVLKAIKFYNDSLKAYLSVDTILTKYWVKSTTYCDYLLSREVIESRLSRAAQELEGELPIEDVFDRITKRYVGEVRDKVIALLYSAYYNSGTKRLPYDAAIKDIRSTVYRDMVVRLKNAVSIGSKAYDFVLPDSSGNIHRLSDYRNKVVIVDFWFSNCPYCADLNRDMSAVYEHFSNSSDVVFVNINMDLRRSDWINSLKKGYKGNRYAHDSSIGVSTYGFGMNHPLVKFYNLIGAPYLLIIDKKGNILDPNPPLPHPSRMENVDKMITIIEDARNNL